MTNNYVHELRSHISALSQLGNALMPTILVEGDETHNGKVPSLIRPDGTVSLIRGRYGWSENDLNTQIELANKHGLMLGIAVQPPQGLLIIDLDVQNYPGGQEELMHDYELMVKASPILNNTRTERTTNGGLHIYVRVSDLSAWTRKDSGLRKNLCRTPYGIKRGELLSSNSICITAPSFGRYTILGQTPIDQVVTIERLDEIGIYPYLQKQFANPTSGVVNTSKLATRFRLRELLGPKASKVLSGEYAYSDTNSSKKDRSLQLVGFAKEAYGVENLVQQLGANVSETADELIESVIGKFALDDKADRVLASIEDDRSSYTASRPDLVKQKLGINLTTTAGRKSIITPDLAEAEITKIFGKVRERIRNGDIVTGDGSIIEREALDLIYIDLCKLTPYQWNSGLAKHAVLKLAMANRYDHIREHFLDLVGNTAPLPDNLWNRLDQLLFGIDDPITAMFMPKYLIGAANRLMEPGCAYVATPILIGGQGIGKSASAKVLFGAEFVVDDLGHELSKDDVSRAHSFFCTELAEVDGITSKSDRERLKAFLTRTVDVYRPPYGASNVTRPRAFVFWGTSNSVPLNDPSGNRRFVAVDLRSKTKANPIPLAQIQQYREAVWARALQEYYAGASYELNGSEQTLVNSQNSLFTVTDAWGERLTRMLALDSKHTCLSVEDAFTILAISAAQQTAANQKRLREVLESLGYQSTKVTLPDGRRGTRLTRQIGKKQIPVDVNRCMGF